MKRLIINADDFGLHEAINKGIIEGHKNGCITSATIMPGGNAFEHAIRLVSDNTKLGVGIHLSLVGAKTVAKPEAVPSLVDDSGLLPKQYPVFLRSLASGRINLSDVRRELAAQIEKTFAAGIKPTHLDSHQHMHVVPGVIDIVIQLANEYGVKALRIPDEPYFFFGGYRCGLGRFFGRCGLAALATLARKKARKSGLIVPENFFGMLAGGNMDEKKLLNIVNQLPDGSSEIMLHPGLDDRLLNSVYGWQYNWQSELAAVTNPALKNLIRSKQVELISFRELIHE